MTAVDLEPYIDALLSQLPPLTDDDIARAAAILATARPRQAAA